MSTKTRIATLVAAALTVAALPGVAFAGSASTPVGQLTANQVGCNDPGAMVLVTVTGGFPNKSYTAISDYPYQYFGPMTFTTNASGTGSVTVGQGWWHDTHNIIVTANGLTGTVSYEANCDDGWGD